MHASSVIETRRRRGAPRRAPPRALLTLLAGLALPVAADVTPVEQDPATLVRQLFERLFVSLGEARAAHDAGSTRVSALVDALLAPHFDADYTAHLVLGAQWRLATDAQRQRCARALYRRLLRTYADAVAQWTPQRVRILPLQQDAAALQVSVRTEVARSDGSPTAVDYRLRRDADAWKIYDVIVDGASYARTWHDDIATEVAQHGLEAALARLEQGAEAVTSPAGP